MRILLLLSLIVPSFAHAANTDPAQPRPPVLMVRPDQKQPSKSLKLSQVSIEVTIAGNTAKTSTTMTFKNELDRVLEGQLFFPIPAGSTVSGYALDIDKQMIDAVVVEKHEARYIFEKEQRKGIDPGLIEWVKGNNFRTRVWPIPKKGERTIRVEYVSELNTQKDGKRLFQLPLILDKGIDALNMSVRVVGESPVNISAGKLELESIDEGKTALITSITRDLKNALNEKLEVTLAAQKKCEVHLGKGPKARRTYFVIKDQQAEPNIRWEPHVKGRIAIYWDASNSRSNSDIKRDLALAQRIISTFAHGTVDVIAFRDRMAKVVSFHVDPKDADKAIQATTKHLREIAYDGGTNLGALRIEKNYANLPGAVLRGEAVDYVHAFLFTDGLGNRGDDMPKKIDMPGNVVSSAQQINRPLLRHIASSSGGM